MAKYSISASYKDTFKEAKAKLWLLSFKEDGTNIVYSPALDLNGSGYTEKEALSSFNIALEEFMRYTLNKKTISAELKRLGWKITGNAKNPKFKSPELSAMLIENKELERLLSNKEFKKIDKEISIPAFA